MGTSQRRPHSKKAHAGSSAEEAIESNKEFASSLKSVKKYEDNLTALNDLEVGGIDAVVMDSVVADYTIKIGKRNLTVVEESLSKEAYGIGFRNDENGIELRDKVQKVLLEMAEDGTVAKISENWFGKDISVIGK